jgi:hypothetical protein
MLKLTLPIPLDIFRRILQEGYGALSIYRGKFVVFENCTFSDSLGYPAGVYIKYSSLLMNGNSFFRNKGWGGVSMYIENSHAKANCNKFEENEANDDPGYGAAFYLFESSLDAKLNIFTKNKAIGGYGGAIEVDFSQLYLTSNTFTSNTAAYGGAILGYESAMMTNADSFTDNAASVVSICSTRFLFQIILVYQSLTDIAPCLPFLEWN